MKHRYHLFVLLAVIKKLLSEYRSLLSYHLFVLLAVMLASCEIFEPKIGTLSITAKYETPFGKLHDAGSTIYIFNDLNIHFTDLEYDGKESLVNGKQTVKYDHTATLDNLGMFEIKLKRGTYTVVCVSNHIERANGKSWILTSVNLHDDREELNFDFKL